MLTATTPAPKQVLLRLPDDVAAKLARAVAPRKRNQFLIDLLRRELDKEDQALIDACESLNRMEAANPALRAEATEWLEADLVASVDKSDSDFDAKAFSREAARAQAEPARKPRPKRRSA